MQLVRKSYKNHIIFDHRLMKYLSNRASLVAKNWRSILIAIFPICLTRFNQFMWNFVLDGQSRFGQTTLNESVPSLGHRRHQVIKASCRYFANKEQLRNSVKHEAVICMTVGTTRWSPRVSSYNSLGDSVVTTRLWVTKVMLQVMPSVPPPANPAASLLHWDDCQNLQLHITLSTVEWNEGMNIDYSGVVTCAFFTNLERWKFPYENHFSQKSCENCTISSHMSDALLSNYWTGTLSKPNVNHAATVSSTENNKYVRRGCK